MSMLDKVYSMYLFLMSSKLSWVISFHDSSSLHLQWDQFWKQHWVTVKKLDCRVGFRKWDIKKRVSSKKWIKTWLGFMLLSVLKMVEDWISAIFTLKKYIKQKFIWTAFSFQGIILKTSLLASHCCWSKIKTISLVPSISCLLSLVNAVSEGFPKVHFLFYVL